MQTGLLHLHNFLRWVILILLVISIFKAYSGWKNKKTFSAGDGKLWLFTMISAHITLLLGLYQVAFGRFGFFTTPTPDGVGAAIHNRFYHFFWIEHPVTMIVAIVFITLGRGMAKKAVPDETKYRKAFWFFLVALLLILAAVPWPFWGEPIARPLFPGMPVH